MRELVVVSGKGGTGKTSVVASFAALAARDGGAVVADCDVDAPDLYLVLEPEVKRREEFRAGHVARIREADCVGCGACVAHCRFDAVARQAAKGGHKFLIDPVACEGCGVCVSACPQGAIDFPDKVAGEWFVSEARTGALVHARLFPGEDNSGKLVSKIREEARDIAEKEGRRLVIADGSPGIGCPVIASVTGADLVLIVAEPTVSGLHDFLRVAALAAKMRMPAAVCVNRADLNTGVAVRIEAEAGRRGMSVLARVPTDEAVTRAQMKKRSVVESSPEGPAAVAIRGLWDRLGDEVDT